MLNFFKRDKDKKEQKLEDVIEDKNREKSVESEGEGKKEKQGLFSRLKSGLSKTRDGFINQVSSLFASYGRIDDELFEELEEILIQADVGVRTTIQLVEELKERVEEEGIKEPEKLNELFREQLTELLKAEYTRLELADGLNILMVVGVNGVGKTTTIAKIAQRYKNEGKSVLLAAGDTFRAAAIDQLRVWSDGLESISLPSRRADAAAVAYDAVQAAKARMLTS